MSDERFTLDTNILVYSVDRAAGTRHQKAITIVRRAILAECWLTLQAISEFYAVVTRKRVMAPTDAARLAGYWLDLFPTAAASADSVRTALAITMAGRGSYWDALLVATAAEIGCTVILTEDLADGGTLQGVRIVNPFTKTTHAPFVAHLLAEE